MHTIVTWLWRPRSRWRTDYSASDVNGLVEQLARHVTVPHRVVCVTDMPEGIECETIPLWPDVMTPRQAGTGANCWNRLRAFANDAAGIFGTDRILSIDLDVAIYSNIDDLVLEQAPFRITRKADQPRHYNGSLWSLKLGAHPEVWQDFDPGSSPMIAHEMLEMRGIKPTGSDQSWFTHKLRGVPTWGREHGLYHYWALDDKRRLPPNCRMLFFSGKVKQADLPDSHPLAAAEVMYD
jgi:hypothetical protein